MNPEIAPVLEEIKAVLKKHDMLGLIVVSNKTHSDFFINVEASWSCARLEKVDEKGFYVRIRSKRDEYPSKEAQDLALSQTVGTFVAYTDMLPNLYAQFESLLAMCSQQMEIDRKSTQED